MKVGYLCWPGCEYDTSTARRKYDLRWKIRLDESGALCDLDELVEQLQEGRSEGPQEPIRKETQ
jgi:hypothetical protein